MRDDEKLYDLTPCSDAHCILAKQPRTGQHTNGGCNHLKERGPRLTAFLMQLGREHARRMEAEAETPSEAEARAAVLAARFPDQQEAALAAYRAAVLRAADAETVALVERLRHWHTRDPLIEAEEMECKSTRLDADAWLAKRGGGR